MQIGRISNATRVLGKSQGYIGLPVLDASVPGKDGTSIRCMSSAWLPNTDEILALNLGAPLIVKLLTKEHPPISVDVGEVPDWGNLQASVASLLVTAGVNLEIATKVAKALHSAGLHIVPTSKGIPA